MCVAVTSRSYSVRLALRSFASAIAIHVPHPMHIHRPNWRIQCDHCVLLRESRAPVSVPVHVYVFVHYVSWRDLWQPPPPWHPGQSTSIGLAGRGIRAQALQDSGLRDTALRNAPSTVRLSNGTLLSPTTCEPRPGSSRVVGSGTAVAGKARLRTPHQSAPGRRTRVNGRRVGTRREQPTTAARESMIDR